MRALLVAWGLAMGCTAHAQPFTLLGTATDNGDGCVVLTPDEPFAQGLAWSNRPLDLTQPFSLTFDIYLGDDDDGADGIAFVMQADPRGTEAYGSWGECLSYGQMGRNSFVSQSLAVEFDTYYNAHRGDPEVDHVAYLEHGESTHTQHYAPTPDYNLEDGRTHRFFVVWAPATRELTVKLDGVTVHQRQQDLVATVFGGTTEVLWGFTASTGRAHNLQYFCLRTVTSSR